MRAIFMAVVAVGAFTGLPALAQDLGLDLSAPEEKKPEPEKAKPPPPPEPAKAPVKPAAQPVELTERDVTLEDRVKSVQRREVLKTHRLEVAPQLGVSVNDAYYTKYGAGAWLLVYPHDSLGFGVRGMYYLTYATENVRTAKRDLLAQLPVSKPNWSLAVDAQWTAIYGKVSAFNTIAQFDLFLVGGVGAVASQTTFLQDGELHFATDLGLGARAMVGDFLAVSVTVLNTVYADRPGNYSRSVVQNLMMAQLGVCVFVPPRFEYEVH